MTLFTTALKKFHKLYSNMVSSGNGTFAGTWLPSLPVTTALPLHLVVIGLAVLLAIYLMRQFKSHKQVKLSVPTNSEGSKISVQHLVWVNEIIRWLFMTSSEEIPASVEGWLHDLNNNLAQQQNKFGALLYGLREGSQPPGIKELRNVKKLNNDIYAEVMIGMTDFGFQANIQEDVGSSLASSSYSVIVAQFMCWFSVVLSRNEDNLRLKFVLAERKPIIRLKMKPITKQTLINNEPEVVAEAIKTAVMDTPFVVDIDFHCQPQTNMREAALSEEEEACYSDTDNESNYKDMKDSPSTPRTSRSLSDGQVLDEPAALRHRAVSQGDSSIRSVPVSRVTTPITNANLLQGFENSPKGLSESLGSLNSMTRTPSGRGPAKPIRIREKRLQVKVIDIDGVKLIADHVIHASFQLDFPDQSKNVSCNQSAVFDLCSRSSQLKINVVSKPESSNTEETCLAQSLILIDSIRMDQATRTNTPLHDHHGNQIGSIFVEFVVLENCDAINQSSAMKRNSFSTPRRLRPGMKQITSRRMNGDAGADTPLNASGRLNNDGTKVTMVKKVKGSPSRSLKSCDGDEVATNNGGEVTGVRYNDASVVETALKDLSRPNPKKSVVTKTKILITAIEQNNGVRETLQSEENDVAYADDLSVIPDTVSSIGQSTLSVDKDAEHDMVSDQTASNSTLVGDGFETVSLTREVQMRPKEKLKDGDARVRRTRSLMLGSGKKHRHKRNSLVIQDNNGASPSNVLEIPQNNLRRKKKSRSMTKLFSRMTRGKKGKSSSSEVTVPDDSGSTEAVVDDVENDTLSPTSSSKVKRHRSFKDVLRGKKKHKQ